MPELNPQKMQTTIRVLAMERQIDGFFDGCSSEVIGWHYAQSAQFPKTCSENSCESASPSPAEKHDLPPIAGEIALDSTP